MTTILTVLSLSLFLYILYTAARGQRHARLVASAIKVETQSNRVQAFHDAFAHQPRSLLRP